MEYIYREYECSLSKNNCVKLLQSIALVKASITSTFVLTNAFPERTVNRWSMFFKLRFRNQEDLDRFHSMGFKTTPPPQIQGCKISE